MKLLVLIPAFNEENTISDVIEETKKNLPEADILVVNDGSTDRTKQILSNHKNIKALHLPFNMGIGGAIWTGFNFFCKRTTNSWCGLTETASILLPRPEA